MTRGNKKTTLTFLAIRCLLVLICWGNALFAEKSTDLQNADSIEKLQSLYEPISGILPATLPLLSKPYLVTADVYVPAGKTVTIQAGTVLLFKNFTGLHVEGQLTVSGSAVNPVVFSSEYDGAYVSQSELKANPYDWNGIYIHENGVGSLFSNCHIRYSVFGINSLTKYIKLDNIHFANNGRSDFTVASVKQSVSSNPYNYAMSVDDAKSMGVPIKILNDPYVKKRSVFRYGGVGVFVGASSLAVVSQVMLASDSKRLKGLQDVAVVDAKSNMVVHTDADFQAARRSKYTDIALFVSSIGLAVCGVAGLSFSFTF